ncbi:hypothetical protein Pla100_40450 [Neorhodopirellula pilleata]|uniref:Uncharacterized protein n=1 Tax=Neorhodopirellula pilleata TaxID=2714738 RepID=A0A5C6A2J6_9BACT|nr:hypothetical protein Pla100_40450 [Neorhodopirellula pilleata]
MLFANCKALCDTDCLAGVNPPGSLFKVKQICNYKAVEIRCRLVKFFCGGFLRLFVQSR